MTAHTANRVWVDGGMGWMGSNDHYPEERPLRQVEVQSFWMDETPVTVQQFARFVTETGHVTEAERRGFSHVFQMTLGPVPLNNPNVWWVATPKACWRDGQPEWPVTHVALSDAKAYAAWCGGRLPTEAEWEYAARGGRPEPTAYAWGSEFEPGGQRMAHVWQGLFPWYYSAGTSPQPLPVGQFVPNDLGLLDLIGNVWEWTCSAFQASAAPACCSCKPEVDARVLWTAKGGSYLCAAEYCLRYRPAARIGLPMDATTGHVGFRCVYGVCGDVESI